MANVGRELSWQEWVKLTSSLRAEETVHKPWLCKLLAKCIEYPGKSSLVQKNLSHWAAKPETFWLWFVVCFLF